LKQIFISGGTGSLGKALVKYYYNKYKIIVFSRNEFKQWELKQKYPKVEYIIGDIQQPIDLDIAADYIINCAALKHVSTGYTNLWEMVKTNILGTYNLLKWSRKIGIKKFIHISTDKAVKPLNLYGCTKAIAEFHVFDYARKYGNYSVVRFGNLFGSSGSVIPIFCDKYKSGCMVYDISHIDSERFFITFEQACNLIEYARKSKDELIIGKYKAAKIIDIVRAFDCMAKTRTIGLRPGEKIKEDICDNYEYNYYSIHEIARMIREWEVKWK